MLKDRNMNQMKRCIKASCFVQQSFMYDQTKFEECSSLFSDQVIHLKKHQPCISVKLICRRWSIGSANIHHVNFVLERQIQNLNFQTCFRYCLPDTNKLKPDIQSAKLTEYNSSTVVKILDFCNSLALEYPPNFIN